MKTSLPNPFPPRRNQNTQTQVPYKSQVLYKSYLKGSSIVAGAADVIIPMCGNKRSRHLLVEEEESYSEAVLKRVRCEVSPFEIRIPSSLVHQLKAAFPNMDAKLLHQTLEECGNDIDVAIQRLTQLSLQESKEEIPPPAANSPSYNREQWAELFVKEMLAATDVDDAKARALGAVKALENAVMERAFEDAARRFGGENTDLKVRMGILSKENGVLKRAVVIQHERLKELERKEREMEELRGMVSKFQEKVRELEVNNYALSMHLNQALGGSLTGRCNQDVF